MNKYIIPYYYLNAAWGVAMIGLVRLFTLPICHGSKKTLNATSLPCLSPLAPARCFYVGILNFKTLGAKVSRIQRACMAESTDLVSGNMDLVFEPCNVNSPKAQLTLLFIPSVVAFCMVL
jgi:hypothetical protein